MGISQEIIIRFFGAELVRRAPGRRGTLADQRRITDAARPKTNSRFPLEKDTVDATEKELLDLSQQLLNSIDQQDWDTYTRLCDPELTAFEPEGVGNVIRGMAFHKFYFDLEASGLPKQSVISSPLIRMIGDCAVITYIRVCQRLNADGGVPSSAFEETRIWEKQNGEWKHIHFHRSAPGA